ncbi:MAG: hypothetical protein R3250_12090 [Melioribacteraceae bacterium]|nr:hypothetical protein [Melioribacteraceae bacterium]
MNTIKYLKKIDDQYETRRITIYYHPYCHPDRIKQIVNMETDEDYFLNNPETISESTANLLSREALLRYHASKN